jgi:hypothetical protein
VNKPSSSTSNPSSKSKTGSHNDKKSNSNKSDDGSDDTSSSTTTDSEHIKAKPTLNVELVPYERPTTSLTFPVHVVTNDEVSGTWSYMLNGKPSEKVKTNQSKMEFSIPYLDPSRIEVLTFHFKGEVGGEPITLSTEVSIPTVQTNFQSVNDSAMITVKPTGLETQGKMAVVFYDMNNKFVDGCEGTVTCIINDFDEKQSYKVNVYYAGLLSSQQDYDEFEYAHAQTGVFQNGAFSLQKPEKYQVKMQIEEKIDEIKIQLKNKQDEETDAVYMFIGAMFLVAALLPILIVFRRVKR